MHLKYVATLPQEIRSPNLACLKKVLLLKLNLNRPIFHSTFKMKNIYQLKRYNARQLTT